MVVLVLEAEAGPDDLSLLWPSEETDLGAIAMDHINAAIVWVRGRVGVDSLN